MKYLDGNTSRRHPWVVALSLMISLTACSGGGGGGGGASTGSSVQPVAYTGNLNNAAVTSANSGTLADASMTGGGIAGSMAVGASISPQPVSGEPYLVKTANAVQKSLIRAYFAPLSTSGMHLNGTTTGPCSVSGSTTVNITVDDATGNLTGDMSFSACSDVSGESISGAATITGHMLGVNTSKNPQLDLLKINGTLAFTDVSGSFTFTGNLVGTFTYADVGAVNPSDISVVANVDTRDDATGIYLRLTNFTVAGVSVYNNNGTLSYEDDSLSGTVCHSVEGCVTAQTVTAFRFYGTDPWPSSGQLVVTGAGNTRARLTALNNTQYTLEWDANGDGTYEGVLPNQQWSTL